MDVILVAEDEVGEAVMCRLLSRVAHLHIYQSFRKGGVSSIKRDLNKYRSASRAIPHVVFVDLDSNVCAPQMLNDWGFNPDGDPRLMLRIAVREAEAWLLADKKGISNFLKVSESKIPDFPERLDDPKRALVNLARRSRNKRFSAEMIPSVGSAASVGVLYNSHLSSFVRDAWNIEAARVVAPSLVRAIDRLDTFMIG